MARIIFFDRLWALIATLGPVGPLKGSGSIASLIAFVIIYFMHNYLSLSHYLVITLLLTIISLYIIERALIHFDTDEDLPSIVLDEVVGAWVACIALPHTFGWYAAAFLLFRFFDITKYAGIAAVERLPRTWGIVFDDCAAGLLAAVICAAIRYTQGIIS